MAPTYPSTDHRAASRRAEAFYEALMMAHYYGGKPKPDDMIRYCLVRYYASPALHAWLKESRDLPPIGV